jgi:hypothetical protein
VTRSRPLVAVINVGAAAVIAAIDKARADLAPGPNEWRSDWLKQETLLNEIRAAAEWTIAHRWSLHVGLVLSEIALIAPYL